MGNFCGTNVLSQIDDATQAQSVGIEEIEEQGF
jgi:hypothetical protein